MEMENLRLGEKSYEVIDMLEGAPGSDVSLWRRVVPKSWRDIL